MRRLALLLGALALIATAYPAAAGAKTIKVSPGGSIQAAVDQADPGDNVSVAPGTYTECRVTLPVRARPHLRGGGDGRQHQHHGPRR